MVTDLPIFFPIQENVFTVSLPETEEFSVESAPVESAPVVRLIYYNFHPYKFCGDIELVLEELVLTKLGSILVKDIKVYNQFDTK
ncbi:hypothetical protein MFLAVUS_009784 [Mucor flavus]|uniref:Uncharacterized protein n=1 Tax=Mucor flavus TaxID=439312 RepID=A0ABP9ZAX0_9FUNG